MTQLSPHATLATKVQPPLHHQQHLHPQTKVLNTQIEILFHSMQYAGIMITGGPTDSVELYDVQNGRGCRMANLPAPNYWHTQVDILWKNIQY